IESADDQGSTCRAGRLRCAQRRAPRLTHRTRPGYSSVGKRNEGPSVVRAMLVNAGLALSITVGIVACHALVPTDPGRIPEYVGTNGKFSKPTGAGPFPAVVIMHGCGGPPGHQEWIGRLNDW